MKRNIFREKNIERVSSPEQLNQYIKISRPSIWLILAAVILLLISVAVWGVMGRLDTTVSGHAIVQDGQATCLLIQQDAKKVKVGLTFESAGVSGIITHTPSEPYSFETLKASFGEYALHAANISEGDWWCSMEIDLPVADGIYPVKIIIDSVSPTSFLFN